MHYIICFSGPERTMHPFVQNFVLADESKGRILEFLQNFELGQNYRAHDETLPLIYKKGKPFNLCKV
jgi:hypothetical protein